MNTKWEVDSLNSYVGFELKHLKISKLIGDFKKFSGCITVNDEMANKLSDLILYTTVASIDTRYEKRNRVLTSPSCLSASRFPQAHFKSLEFVPIDGEHFLVNGILYLKDSFKEIQFTAFIGGTAMDENNHKKLGLELTATISRKDFNLDMNLLSTGKKSFIADNVDLHLHLQFLNTSENYDV